MTWLIFAAILLTGVAIGVSIATVTLPLLRGFYRYRPLPFFRSKPRNNSCESK